MSNEAKFTKCPWLTHIDPELYNEVGPQRTKQTFVAVHANKVLGMDKEERDANTNLIAAAPEMYEMLEMLTSMPTYDAKHFLESDDSILKLLAKARGE